jgi:hypothetical protein
LAPKSSWTLPSPPKVVSAAPLGLKRETVTLVGAWPANGKPARTRTLPSPWTSTSPPARVEKLVTTVPSPPKPLSSLPALSKAARTRRPSESKGTPAGRRTPAA